MFMHQMQGNPRIGLAPVLLRPFILQLSMKIRTILFDLDGTLVDNFEAIYQSYVWLLKTLELPPVSYDEVRRAVGGSAPVTLRKILGEHFREEHVPQFLRYFNENYDVGLRLLPGAKDIMEHFQKEPHTRQAVFTNKNHGISQKVCASAGITPYMEAVEGARPDQGLRKPERKFTEFMLNRLGARPEDTIIIGDSPYDAQAGRAVDIPLVYLVATGTHSMEELREQTDADGIFENLDALRAARFS